MSEIELRKVKVEILNLTLKNIILIGTIGAAMGGVIATLFIKG